MLEKATTSLLAAEARAAGLGGSSGDTPPLADESSGDTPSFNFSTQQYEEVRELGRGTYSRALLLRSLTTGKFAVSKQIWVAGLASDRTELKRIAREVNILASLDHQNIIGYRGARREGELLCILTEYAAGGTLRDAINLRRTSEPSDFPIDLILMWAAELACALRVVHGANVLHRDLKSENIFLTAAAHIKLGDFGLSRNINEDEFATTTCGTPYYMAPEQVSRKAYAQPADVWAYGVVLTEMLTLQRPFNANSFDDLARVILTADYDYATLEQAAHPPSIKRLVTRDALLQPDPERRMTLPQMLDVLRGLVVGRHAASSASDGSGRGAPRLVVTSGALFEMRRVPEVLRKVQQLIDAQLEGVPEELLLPHSSTAGTAQDEEVEVLLHYPLG